MKKYAVISMKNFKTDVPYPTLLEPLTITEADILKEWNQAKSIILFDTHAEAVLYTSWHQNVFNVWLVIEAGIPPECKFDKKKVTKKSIGNLRQEEFSYYELSDKNGITPLEAEFLCSDRKNIDLTTAKSFHDIFFLNKKLQTHQKYLKKAFNEFELSSLRSVNSNLNLSHDKAIEEIEGNIDTLQRLVELHDDIPILKEIEAKKGADLNPFKRLIPLFRETLTAIDSDEFQAKPPLVRAYLIEAFSSNIKACYQTVAHFVLNHDAKESSVQIEINLLAACNDLLKQAISAKQELNIADYTRLFNELTALKEKTDQKYFTNDALIHSNWKKGLTFGLISVSLVIVTTILAISLAFASIITAANAAAAVLVALLINEAAHGTKLLYSLKSKREAIHVDDNDIRTFRYQDQTQTLFSAKQTLFAAKLVKETKQIEQITPPQTVLALTKV